MRERIVLVLSVVIIWCFITIDVSQATTLVIKMQDGNVITLDTSKILSMTYSDSGSPGTVGISISGSWTSSESGSMVIQQSGIDIQGTFPLKNGRIMGKLDGNTMGGYWVQDSSGRRCSYPRDNSFYWGRIVLTFAPQSYSGNWGYCDDEPRSPWNGVRK